MKTVKRQNMRQKLASQRDNNLEKIKSYKGLVNVAVWKMIDGLGLSNWSVNESQNLTTIVYSNSACEIHVVRTNATESVLIDRRDGSEAQTFNSKNYFAMLRTLCEIFPDA